MATGLLCRRDKGFRNKRQTVSSFKKGILRVIYKCDRDMIYNNSYKRLRSNKSQKKTTIAQFLQYLDIRILSILANMQL